MSILSDKINSYAIEYGVSFNQAYTLNPTFTGSAAPTGTPRLVLTGTAPTYDSAIGPVGGGGSWRHRFAPGAGGSYLRTNVPTVVPSKWMDGNYSTGFWFMLTYLPTTSTNLHIMNPNGTGNPGFQFVLMGSTDATYPSRVRTNLINATYDYIGPTIEANTWYYIAHRKSTTSNTAQVYFNGELVLSGTNTNTSPTNTFAQFGYSGTNSTASMIDYHHSDWYVAPYSAIGATEISDIWAAGSGLTNITVDATPATASALMDDHLVILGTSVTIFATPLNGTNSEFLEPQRFGPDDRNISVAPITADALMVDPTIVIPVTYYKLVNDLNPIFYIKDGTKPTTNYGSADFGSGTFDSGVKTGNAGVPLSYIGEGNAWWVDVATSDSAQQITFNGAGGVQALKDAFNAQEVTFEFWMKPTINSWNKGQLLSTNYFSLDIGLQTTSNVTFFIFMNNNTDWEHQIVVPLSTVSLNNWHHFVVTIQSPTSGNLRTQLWIDGQLQGTKNAAFTLNSTQVETTTKFEIFTSAAPTNPYIDEIAVYPQAISNSDIIDHYNYVITATPDRLVYAEVANATILLREPAILAIDNNNFPATPVACESMFLDPTWSAEVNILNTAGLLEASADSVEPYFYGNPDAIILAEQFIINAEMSNNNIALDETYNSYVAYAVSPYRYVSFDGLDKYQDYGSDADYAFATPTVVEGIITTAQNGINNYSALTLPISYQNEGVILKESEFNDDWGTSGDHYYFSFWIKKWEGDANDGNLKIIADAFGYHNNHHITVYQEADVIKVEIYDSESAIQRYTAESLPGYDVFDYNRHNVVVRIDKSSSSNHYVTVFLDSDEIIHENFGALSPNLVNGIINVPANEETYNRNRFAVGTLITPIGYTALSEEPTPIACYIDEILWHDAHITNGDVVDLYNAMPDKTPVTYPSGALTASAAVVNPVIGVSTTITAEYMSGAASAVEPTLKYDYTIYHTSLTASAEMVEPFSVIGDSVLNAVIASDVMVASALIVDAELGFGVRADIMLATAEMATSLPVWIDPYNLLIMQQTLRAPGSMALNGYLTGDIDTK